MKKLNNIFKHPIAGLSIRILLGSIFIYASLDKISNPGAFAEILYNYRIFPLGMVNLIAIILPWVEFFLGVFLILGVAPYSSSFLYSIIIFCFMIVLLQAIVRGLDISCGCFSTSHESGMVSNRRFVEDVGLLILSGFLFLGPASLWKWRLGRKSEK